MRQCTSPVCGLLWLDPVPGPETLRHAYSNYYTHDNSTELQSPTFAKRVYRLTINTIMRVTGVQAERKMAETMSLASVPPGRVLDIGCGSGHLLNRLRLLGWIGVGFDFDPDAVATARRDFQLDAHVGGIEDVPAAIQLFDVITAAHVIEHVPDPVSFLRHCRRLLKPNGLVVIRTPNASSLGHRLYGPWWRGLEPPRHLVVFTMESLRRVATSTGFAVERLFTSTAMAESVLIVSHFLSKTGRFSPSDTSAGGFVVWKVMGPLMGLRARLRWIVDRGSGEELCAILRIDHDHMED